mgnify:CR=1 FL=1
MNFARKFFKHPWIIIVMSIALTGFLGFFLKDLTIENTIRMFFPKNDESYSRLTKTEDEFGSMISLGISIESKSGSILTPENIQIIKNITDQALKVPYVEDVDSLTHIDYVCNQDGAISASQLIPEDDYDEEGNFIGTKEMIDRLKERLNEWNDMYNRVIIDDSYVGTQIQITLEPKGEEKIAFEQADEAFAAVHLRVLDGSAAPVDGCRIGHAVVGGARISLARQEIPIRNDAVVGVAHKPAGGAGIARAIRVLGDHAAVVGVRDVVEARASRNAACVAARGLHGASRNRSGDDRVACRRAPATVEVADDAADVGRAGDVAVVLAVRQREL